MSSATSPVSGKYAIGLAAIVSFTAELLSEEARVPTIAVPRSFASAAIRAKPIMILRLDKRKNAKTVARLLALAALG